MKTRKLSQPHSLLGLIPLLVSLHNLEEYLGFEQYAQKRGFNVSSLQLKVALLLATIIPSLLAISALGTFKQSPKMAFGLSIPAVFGANALSHVGQMVVFREYSPGAITALFLNLPFAAIFYRQAMQAGFLTGQQLKKIVIWGSLLMAPGAALCQGFGWLVDRLIVGKPAPGQED